MKGFTWLQAFKADLNDFDVIATVPMKIYLRMIQQMNRGGHVFPKVSQMTKSIGIDASAYHKGLKTLEKYQFIAKEGRGHYRVNPRYHQYGTGKANESKRIN